MKIHLLPTLLLLFLASTLRAQDPAVLELVREAIPLMDDGQYEESRAKLEAARKLDPKNYLVAYEYGYSYYLEEDYATSAKYFKKAAKLPDANYQAILQLANAYDYVGKPKKAMKTYLQGKEAFPDLAQFDVELGIMAFRQENYDEAVNHWENGIRTDPNYPSNYYHLAALLATTDKHLWTVFYAEQFINLERNSERTVTMSKLLLETLNKVVDFEGDSLKVNFIRNHVMSIDPSNISTKDGEPKLDFKLPGTLIYGLDQSLAVVNLMGDKEINSDNFHVWRAAFLDVWQEEHRQTYPNALHEWLYTIREAGHLEAYNHWLLSAGDEVGFEMWMSNNPSLWEAFVEWFNENMLEYERGEATIRPKL